MKSNFVFYSTGVDCLGLVLVKPISSDIGKSFYKTRIVWFACAATRTVLLDVVSDYSASSFVKSLERFNACRGIPKLFLSDKVTHFKNDEVKNCWNWEPHGNTL